MRVVPCGQGSTIESALGPHEPAQCAKFKDYKMPCQIFRNTALRIAFQMDHFDSFRISPVGAATM